MVAAMHLWLLGVLPRNGTVGLPRRTAVRFITFELGPLLLKEGNRIAAPLDPLQEALAPYDEY